MILYESYHVWALGSLFGSPQFSIVKGCGPFEPHSSANPFIGTRDVPVTNCNNRTRDSGDINATACQNHSITLYITYYTIKQLITYLMRGSVSRFVICILFPIRNIWITWNQLVIYESYYESSLPRPHMSSSSSLGSNKSISPFGIIS